MSHLEPPCPKIPIPRVSTSMQIKDRPSQPPEGLPARITFPLLLGLEEPAIIVYITNTSKYSGVEKRWRCWLSGITIRTKRAKESW